MKNRNTGLALIVLGMIFFMLAKILTLSDTIWNVLLLLNVVCSLGGTIILILYIRNERGKSVQ